MQIEYLCFKNNPYYLETDNRGKWQARGMPAIRGNVNFISPYQNTRENAVSYAERLISRGLSGRLM